MGHPSDDQNADRIEFAQVSKGVMRNCPSFGNSTPSNTSSDPSLCTISLILTGSPSRPEIVQRILNSLSFTLLRTLDDENDNFEFICAQHGLDIGHVRSRSSIVFKDGVLRSSVETPLFDRYSRISFYPFVRKELSLSDPSAWGIGQDLQYGEVITGTQTLLDK